MKSTTMKGKNRFSENEASQIRKLIKRKLMASTSDQKFIRNKIRDLKFYFSDFSGMKVYTIDDFDLLIRTGQIQITGNEYSSQRTLNELKIESPLNTDVTEIVREGKIEHSLIAEGNFKPYSDLDAKILDSPGFYCLRLKPNSSLPKKYQYILDKRKLKYIYIGKAEGQRLRDRLAQEIEHKSPGTFFRSIGCVLGYFPMAGHLKGHVNQDNYKFSPSDTTKIVNWLKSNIELSIVQNTVSFDIEKELIERYCPLLNDTHNPLKLQELKDDKAICRKIARG
jgi:hypothetical protein